MTNSITPTAFTRLFVSTYVELDRDAFVINILDDVPRQGDLWQYEKFELFQTAARALARLATEITENIIDYAILHRRTLNG